MLRDGGRMAVPAGAGRNLVGDRNPRLLMPCDVQKDEDIVGLFGAFVGKARAVRRLGSAAIDLCYVACGRLDGFWEMHLGPWDIAAGALLGWSADGLVERVLGDMP